MNNVLNIDFARGELVATARALLTLYSYSREGRVPCDVDTALEYGLARLIHNAFQFHGSDIGDPIQLAHLILLMNGELSINP